MSYFFSSSIVAFTNQSTVEAMAIRSNWQELARSTVKKEIINKSLTYQDVADALLANGVNDTAEGVANKLSRGAFSAVWMLQVFVAIDCKNIVISDFKK